MIYSPIYTHSPAVPLNITAISPLQIIHRDLKSLNVVLTEDMRAKIIDFGDAKIGENKYDQAAGLGTHAATQKDDVAANVRETYHTTLVHGTAAWMSPETWAEGDRGMVITPAVDVFRYL
jgi:serine/threonine protein kinase